MPDPNNLPTCECLPGEAPGIGAKLDHIYCAILGGGGGALLSNNNLSDVQSVPESLENLGLDTSLTTPDIVRTYADAVGATPEALIQISGWYNDLVDAGVSGNLVDACLLRVGQNTGNNSPQTLRGTVGILTASPVWTPDGVQFDGSTQWGIWTVPSTKPFTLVAECRGVAAGQTSSATLFGMTNSAGATTAGQLCELDTTTDAFVYMRQGATVTISSPINNPGSSTTIHFYNPLPQVNAMTYDNAATPTVELFVDGINAMSDAVGTTQSTSDLDRVTIGARFLTAPAAWDTPYKGTIGCWMLFDRVLTTVELAAVTAAVRKLDARPVNIVILGDSLSAQLSDATRAEGNWPARLLQTPTWAGRARLQNMAINGAPTTGLDNDFATRVAAFAPDGIAVKEGWLYVLAGTNDLLPAANGGLARTAAATFVDLQILWAAGRAAGFRVVGITLPPGRSAGAYDAPQEAERLTYNTSIRSANGIQVDVVLDFAEFLDSMAEGSFYVDAIHPSNAGNLLLSNVVAQNNVGGADAFQIDKTITATVGAVTINKPAGAAIVAAGAATVVVTNTLCTAASIVLATIRTNDGTATIKNVVPANGSFTITFTAVATGNTSVGWLLLS